MLPQCDRVLTRPDQALPIASREAVMSKRYFLLPATIALAITMLIGATRTGSAAETPVSSTVSQKDGAGQSDTGAKPAQATPVQYSVPLGTVGFGWG